MDYRFILFDDDFSVFGDKQDLSFPNDLAARDYTKRVFVHYPKCVLIVICRKRSSFSVIRDGVDITAGGVGLGRKVFSTSFGNVGVSIGDVFDWTGANPGRYKVVRWSPVRGNCVIVENAQGVETEWYGDSVAIGVQEGRVV